MKKLFIIFILFLFCFQIFSETARDDIRGGLPGTIAFFSILILIAIGAVIWSNHDKKENQKKYKKGESNVKNN